MGLKYLVPLIAIVGFASIVINKITEKDPLIIFTFLFSGSFFCLIFYYFFIYCTCKLADRFNVLNNDKN
jgi:hypothetical protein